MPNFAGKAKGRLSIIYFQCENDDPHHVGTGGQIEQNKMETTTKNQI